MTHLGPVITNLEWIKYVLEYPKLSWMDLRSATVTLIRMLQPNLDLVNTLMKTTSVLLKPHVVNDMAPSRKISANSN